MSTLKVTLTRKTQQAEAREANPATASLTQTVVQACIAAAEAQPNPARYYDYTSNTTELPEAIRTYLATTHQLDVSALEGTGFTHAWRLRWMEDS